MHHQPVRAWCSASPVCADSTAPRAASSGPGSAIRPSSESTAIRRSAVGSGRCPLYPCLLATGGYRPLSSSVSVKADKRCRPRTGSGMPGQQTRQC